MEWQTLLAPYNPWQDPARLSAWREALPRFRRPVFRELLDDLASIEQYISIIGPRRVGKSTLLKQLVDQLLTDGVPPSRVFYYSLDDPALLRAGNDGHQLLDTLSQHLCGLGGDGPVYLMLDEIQTLPNWELYLKKFYDLKYPIRILISGSASSPIFKKSRESLLGRIKDYHVLPFSYREFLLYRLQGDPDLKQQLASFDDAGGQLRGMLTHDPEHRDLRSVTVPQMSDALWSSAQQALDDFFVEGGFPEVWTLPTEDLKIDYLFDNQVQKVIFEDLVLAAEFRKPEQLKAFYVSLLEYPGREVSRATLSRDLEIPAAAIEKYLPLLAMTDLIRHAEKFRKSAVRLRTGNRKFYLVDLALRNAVLRLGRDRILDDPAMLGLYAENLVFNALKKWRGTLGVDFYRDGRDREIDFIVHVRHGTYWPIEVKYRRQVKNKDLDTLRRFGEQHNIIDPMIITRERDQIGMMDHGGLPVFRLPLLIFLLLLD